MKSIAVLRSNGGLQAWAQAIRKTLARATRKTAYVAVVFAATVAALPAQTFNSIFNFDGTNGEYPQSEALVQGRDGNLYGTTEYGGKNSAGTVFKIASTGALTTIYNFCSLTSCADSGVPAASLTLGINGNFYGVTLGGNVEGYGSVFEVTPGGVLKTLYTFCHSTNCPDGWGGNSALVLGADGNFYGTTKLGGVGGCGGCHGGGVAFKITPAGAYTKIHDFCTGACTDGTTPQGLVQGTDGNFYGTALSGGANSAGTVFKMTSAGVVTTLYAFCAKGAAGCPDGINPAAALVQGNDGNFYGSTDGDDSNSGTIFKITPAGALTTLYSLNTGTIGAEPLAPLILGNDGNFYGGIYRNYPDGNCCGYLFKMTPAGAVTVLHPFLGTDGNGVFGMVEATGGSFYGVTYNGGSSNLGTVYRLADGRAAFVRLVANHGKVGSTVEILGQGLTGATAVSFDGVAATFTNVEETYMTAVVPTGALTGTVTVTTFTGSYKSILPFRVTPQFTSFTPSSGKVGSVVTITGDSLKQTSKVTIGGKPATFTVVSDTKVTATIPVGAKTGLKITVTTAGGTATSTAPLAVVPSITSFTPTSGPVGTSVKITGNSFTGATELTFGGVAATSREVVSDTQVDAVVPTGAVTGTIAVTTPGGTGTSSTKFTVTE